MFLCGRVRPGYLCSRRFAYSTGTGRYRFIFMTTGNIPYGTSLVDKTGTRFGRSWSGGDGRYELYAGSYRDKWNNFTLDHRQRTRLQKDYSYKRKPAYGGNVVTGTLLVGEAPLTLSWSANDELKLQSKLLNKLKSHDFNLAVNAAQANQLVSMVDSNLRKLGRAALNLRRGNFAGAARELGAKPKTSRLKASDVSGRWLEMQYGWLPALSDTYEAAKAFEAISNGPRSSTVTAGSNRQTVLSQTAGSIVSYDIYETYARQIKYEMYEEMSVPRQLGLEDPLSVAWEICPWSFVVDWFIPIGSYLENLNQIPKLRGRFLTTVFRTATYPLNMRWVSPLPVFCQYGIYYPYLDRGRYVTVSRTASTQLTVPLPVFRGKGAVKGNRVWNAIALAQQAFTGTVMRR